MVRLPRYNLPGQPQHVILRGNNRSIIFAADDDYRFFVDCLEDAATRYGCAIHAYVLMTNYVHFLTTPERDESIGKALQSAGRRYVQYFNDSYRRTGALWEGRYKATLIDSENYLLTRYRYIELNPVRADMAARTRDYAWSRIGRIVCSAEKTVFPVVLFIKGVYMQHVLIIHEVESYPTWKAVFDQAADIRKRAGEISYQLLRYDNNASKIVHFSQWSSLDNARRFFESPELVEIRKKAGVKSEPPRVARRLQHLRVDCPRSG